VPISDASDPGRHLTPGCGLDNHNFSLRCDTGAGGADVGADLSRASEHACESGAGEVERVQAIAVMGAACTTCDKICYFYFSNLGSS
jgi:hypothetical protein